MKITITNPTLCGSVHAISSKSDVHRLLICAALSDAPTHITCGDASADIDATIRCLCALGADISRTAGGLRVQPLDKPIPNALLDCGESGSTLRFLLPVACALGAGAAFTGTGRLPQRPLSPLYDELVRHGCTLSAQGIFPLTCAGQLRGGGFTLAANVSSQFISGLLLALPLLEDGGCIALTGRMESAPYVDMTISALSRFGVDVRRTEQCFSIRGGQTLHAPTALCADGDWSNAAFWLCAGALGFGVECRGLSMASLQGDRHILNILRQFGAETAESGGAVRVDGGHLRGIELDASDIPDLVPILAAVAAGADGETVIRGAARLRLKESDRLRTTAQTLNALGGDVTETADGLIIQGRPRLTGGTVSSCGDHRIAMMAAVAAMLCDGPVTILGAEAVNKSYPGFFRDFAALGGTFTIKQEA